jgi:FAD/FMN-containing dehydrogenase
VTHQSWGRLQSPSHDVCAISDRRRLGQDIQSALPGLAYGMGRSYGDECLNPNGNLWLMRGLDRFIAFDQATGRLQCEAGVLLQDIQRTFMPHGWMLPVTPGTRFATVGGAVANDVHGKNHHRLGAFGHHVLGIELVRTTGEVIKCSPADHADWFAATVGGLGLTGVISTVELQLKRVDGPWLSTQTIAFEGLDNFFELADKSEAQWEYTVSWIDCLSGESTRGIFIRGNHAAAGQAGTLPPQGARRVPFTPPISMVNALSLRGFNEFYFRLNRWRQGERIEHYEPFFYPLDNLLEWNRIYGPKGFYQYQCVIPRSEGQQGIRSVLKEIARSGQGSFLAVLKTFGEMPSLGMLSFPQPGVTLALDFPNQGEHVLSLFQKLDAIVQACGGRLYMAKDARMPKALFEQGYPRLNEFLPYRDPGIVSAMSQRLMGD